MSGEGRVARRASRGAPIPEVAPAGSSPVVPPGVSALTVIRRVSPDRFARTRGPGEYANTSVPAAALPARCVLCAADADGLGESYAGSLPSRGLLRCDRDD